MGRAGTAIGPKVVGRKSRHTDWSTELVNRWGIRRHDDYHPAPEAADARRGTRPGSFRAEVSVVSRCLIELDVLLVHSLMQSRSLSVHGGQSPAMLTARKTRDVHDASELSREYSSNSTQSALRHTPSAG